MINIYTTASYCVAVDVAAITRRWILDGAIHHCRAGVSGVHLGHLRRWPYKPEEMFILVGETRKVAPWSRMDKPSESALANEP